MKKLRPQGPECTPSALRTSIAAIGSTLVLALSGCSGSAPVAVTGGKCPDEIASSAATIVLTATATSAEPAVGLPPGLRSQLRRKADEGEQTCVAIVTPQGDLIALDVTPRRANGQVENGQTRARKVEQNLDAVADRLAALAQSQDEPGLNPLSVIDRAIRRHPTPGTLVVISSGVSTVVPVDLRVLGWELDVTGRAARLPQDAVLAGLKGWHVRFVGLGDVAGKQKPLNPALRQRLQNWWTALCVAGGAACTVDTEIISTATPLSRNAVPIVPLPVVKVSASRFDLPGALLFATDSADLEAGADQNLLIVVERALRTGEFVRVTGHTDAITGSAAHNRRLSQRRADAVAARLVRLGLPEIRVVESKGVGQKGSSAVREKSDPTQVGRDRRVEITFIQR